MKTIFPDYKLGPEPIVEHAIRLRAYDLYVRRGRTNGHDFDDWLQAEPEVLRERRADGFSRWNKPAR